MSRPVDKWSCSMCTYDNYQASSKCSLCLQPRGAEVIQLPPVQNQQSTKVKHSQSFSKKDAILDVIISPPECSLKSGIAEAKKEEIQSHSVVKIKNDNLKTFADQPSSSLRILNNSWSCGVCSFVNFPDYAWCSKCNASKISGNNLSSGAATSSFTGSHSQTNITEDKNNKNKKWNCLACTYENWDASQRCAVCQVKRGRDTSDVKQAEDSVLSQQNQNSFELEASSSNSINSLFKLNVNQRQNLLKQESEYGSTSSSVIISERLENPTYLSQVDTNLSREAKNNRSRSPSSSSGSSHSPRDDNHAQFVGQHRGKRNRRHKLDNQACSSVAASCSSQRNHSPIGKLSRGNSSNHLCSSGRIEIMDNRSFNNRTRNLNWVFLKACIGVVDGNAEAVDTYLAHGGNIARSLTLDEINSLNRPSAFDVGHTLVHLAIRFQRHKILALLLTPEIAPRGFKRNPSHLSPDIADLIRREILISIRTCGSDFHCKYLSECTTFQLPLDICDLPPSIQKHLFDELLDQDVQKELEEESTINWSSSSLKINDCSNRLYALWNRSAGDCLLDSVLQATWGVFDRDNVLRTAMSESLHDCSTSFFQRWRDWELYQADLLGFSLTERQCLQDWSFIYSLAQQPGASLEHCHIFVLSHILRRPIIIYGIKYLKNFRGDTLGFAKFQGVYLPFLWQRSFCFTSPIALGYTRGHFTALVTMESDVSARYLNPFNNVNNLPLVDSDGKILPIHFTARGEDASEQLRKEILHEWLDCHTTDDGLLVARQRPGKRPPSVTKLIDEWLDHYRHLSFCRLSEDGDSDDDE